MAASLVETLETWNDAIKTFEGGDARGALALFRQCQDQSATMHFNIGVTHLKLQNYSEAISCFDAALKKDQHLAVGYFQRGVAHHYSSRDADAAKDFEESHRRMRSTRVIDYRQLGMPCKLFECDVLLNLALVLARSGQSSKAQTKLDAARDAQLEKRHEQAAREVSSAVQQGGGSLPVIVLADNALFRPAKTKVANIKKKNFLGDAKVLSSVIDQDQFSGFMGKKELDAGSAPGSPAVSRSPRRSSSGRFGGMSPLFGRSEKLCAQYSFEPNTNLEVALNAGDVVKVKKKDGDGWFTVTNVTSGETGLVPGSYLGSYTSPATSPAPSRKTSDTAIRKKFMPGLPDSSRPSASPTKQLPKPPVKSGKAGPPTPAKPGPPTSAKPGRKPSSESSSQLKSSQGPPVLSKPVFSFPKATSGKDIIVKVHMDHTRALRMSSDTSLDDLLSAVCQKFRRDDGSLSLWSKVDGELAPVQNSAEMANCWREATHNSNRLTLWVYGM